MYTYEPKDCFRLGYEIVNELFWVIEAMEPIVSNGENDCLCVDAPWHYEDYDDLGGDYNGEISFENPANHSSYCPFFLHAYIKALAEGKETPDSDNQLALEKLNGEPFDEWEDG